MLEGIPWAAIGGLTPAALLSITVILVLTGKLVPRSMYDAIHVQKTYWREAAEKLRETNHVQAKTIEKQEIASDTIIRVMDSVQTANKADGGESK